MKKTRQRFTGDRLNKGQRYNVMKDLKTKALEGDIQAILAIGLFEVAETNRHLNVVIGQAGVAA